MSTAGVPATPPAGDPGWPNPLRFLVPFGLGMRRRQDGEPIVTGLRYLWLSFTFAVVMIGVVVAILLPGIGGESGLAPLAAAVVGGYGAASLGVGPRLGRRLDCTDEATLLATYRTRFFLRVAVAEVAALLGFVGFILSGAWWLYPLGAAFTLVGFARVAPTTGNLAMTDGELLAQGCHQSLSQLLLLRATTEPADG